jgi:hypothetical protein
LPLFELRVGRFALAIAVGGFNGFERIVFFVVWAGKSRQQSGPHAAYFLSAIKIANDVLQDALKKHREFVEWFVTIFLREFHHRVLHDVQRRFFISDREQGLLVGAFFDAGEEIR